MKGQRVGLSCVTCVTVLGHYFSAVLAMLAFSFDGESVSPSLSENAEAIDRSCYV